MAIKTGFRQEVFNTELARLLSERGIDASPEDVQATQKGRRLPDVLFDFAGLRTIIECEVDDQPNSQRKAVQLASERVDDGLAHIGIALIYSAALRDVPFQTLAKEMANSTFQIAVITEAGSGDFVSGTVDDLTNLLRNAFDQLVREDVVKSAIAKLEVGINRFAAVVAPQAGTVKRLAQVLGIPDAQLSPAQLKEVTKVSGLVLLNALIFQEVLAEHNSQVKTLNRINAASQPITECGEHWEFILKTINYYSIFYVSREVLLSLSSNKDVLDTFKQMTEIACDIVSLRAALRHDLMGRVFHKLLASAKHLGTYYTAIPSATLLLKLALRSEARQAWRDPKTLENFRVADLSCGTGTLLMACADALIDLNIRDCVKAGVVPDLNEMHKVLTENVLHGYDVLPSAIHLTASTLSLRAPQISFLKTNLYNLPLGGNGNRLGSIEFLESREVERTINLFTAQNDVGQATGKGSKEIDAAPLPKLDLCVMNPPFVRSVGGNLLFGSVDDKERAVMQTKLARILSRNKVLASSTAGLGAVFVATGHRYVKPGGKIALVLPKALLSGVAWDKTRQILRNRYVLESIVVSHDPDAWNFSDSTKLSEVMFVARRLRDGEKAENEPVLAINLWRKMETSSEALAVESQTRNAAATGGIPDLKTGSGAFAISMGSEKIGEATTLPWGELKPRTEWILPASFAQSDLTRAALALEKGQLRLPATKAPAALVSLCRLDRLGTLGPDRRDIHDGFTVTDSPTPFPALWGHDTNEVARLEVKSNKYLAERTQAAAGRKLKKSSQLWPLAGRILLAERLRLNTAKLTAVRVLRPVLSNTWWTFAFKAPDEQREKALVVWLNSTLGFLTLLVNRVETEGAWVDFKKPTLKALPVLNVEKLEASQLAILVAAYDANVADDLQALPHMESDAVRAALDTALSTALGWPDLSPLREMLAREPVVCLKPLA